METCYRFLYAALFVVRQTVTRRTSVDKLAGKSALHTLRERIRVLEIIATTKVSILGEFTDTDRRNWLFYIFQ